jgi:hypothetical protein
VTGPCPAGAADRQGSSSSEPVGASATGACPGAAAGRPAGGEADVEADLALADGGGAGVGPADRPAHGPAADLGEGRGDRGQPVQEHLGHLAGEAVDAVRPPVVVPPVRGAAVEHGLERHIGDGTHRLGQGPADPKQGATARCPAAGSPAQASTSVTTGPPRCSGGRNGAGGASIMAMVMPSSSGAVGAKSSRKASTWAASSSPQTTGPPSTIGPTGCSRYSKAVAIPKLPPPPRSPPQQLRLVLGVDPQPLAVGGDQVDGQQVVDGLPVPAHRVAQPAAQGEPADAGVADDPAGGGQPDLLGGPVELPPQHAAGGRDRSR